MIDRENYNAQDDSSDKLALFRLFLQTSGDPVRRWSMSIKGEGEDHSLTYTFGDLFSRYLNEIKSVVGDQEALNSDGTGTGKKLSTLNCDELAKLSKAWFDKAFKANPAFFGKP